jgi:hypothetical protein
MLLFPIPVRFAVHVFTRFVVRHGIPHRSRAEERPLGAAVSAKTSEIHEVDILHVVSRAHVRQQGAKGVRFDLSL